MSPIDVTELDPDTGATLRRLMDQLSPEVRGEPKRLTPMSGGSINRVYRVDCAGGQALVLKYRRDAPSGFFAAERQGLDRLRETNTVLVPQVLAVDDKGILLEWLPPASAAAEAELGRLLGRALAALHEHTAVAYGLDHDNFIGLLAQTNRPNASWVAFYREQRLEPQVKLAHDRGRLTPQRKKDLAKVLDRLPQWIDERAVAPSLLHGDLWAGNWLATQRGPALIDPAVYFGDPEVDLAMASLFGGFPRTFFEAYLKARPLPPGHEERRVLYQLYYLLIHLNLFGESYGSSVDAALRRLVR